MEREQPYSILHDEGIVRGQSTTQVGSLVRCGFRWNLEASRELREREREERVDDMDVRAERGVALANLSSKSELLGKVDAVLRMTANISILMLATSRI